MKTRVTKMFEFEMAHQLETSYDKSCQNVHGHTYKLEVTFEGFIQGNGMVIDFKMIKELVSPIVKHFDHTFQTVDTFGTNPTAENMANWIFNEIKRKSNQLVKVRLWETSTCYVEVGY